MMAEKAKLQKEDVDKHGWDLFFPQDAIFRAICEYVYFAFPRVRQALTPLHRRRASGTQTKPANHE